MAQTKSKAKDTGTSAKDEGDERPVGAAAAPGTPNVAKPTKAVDEGQAKPATLDDLHTPADHQATPGLFAKITKGEFAGEFCTIQADEPGEDVTVKLHRAPGKLVTLPYADLVQDSPYTHLA